MTWSEEQLRRHKKAAAGLSVATASMGVTALGLAGARAGAPRAVKVAQKAGYLKSVKPKKVKQFQRKTGRTATGLTTGAAGVGGIGGFNFAGIQSAESKRKVSKSMGIDYGLGSVRQGGEISKREPRARTKMRERAEAVGLFAGGAAGAAAPTARRTAQMTSSGYKLSRQLGGNRRGSLRSAATAGGTALRTAPRVRSARSNAIIGGVVGGIGAQVVASQAAGMRYDRQQKSGVRKAYDPERKRARRLENYERSANTLSGAAGAGALAAGVSTSRKKGAFTATRQGGKLTRVSASRGGLKGAAATAGLGLGAVGAAVGADRIKSYRRGSGRSYGRSLTGQF